MELKYKTREKVVGVFFIAIIGLLFFTVLIIGKGQDWFKQSATYYTSFEQGYNLKVGTAVKLSKADIGKVKRITLVKGKVQVQLSILRDYAPMIKTDSVATVESPTFLGDEFVAIKAGSKKAPHLLEGLEIPSKDKLSLMQTLETMDLDQIVNDLMKTIHDVSEIVAVFKESDGPLFTAVNNINSILEDLKKVSEQTPDAMASVNENLESVEQILKGVEENIVILKSVLSNVEKGSDDLPYITQSVRQEMNNLWDLLDEADKIVRSLQENFLIKSNLPPEEKGEAIDAGLRK